jgi:hypothetical protein
MYIENIITGECREVAKDTDLSLRRSMIPEMQYYIRTGTNTIFFPNEDMWDGAPNIVNSVKNRFSKIGRGNLTNVSFADAGVMYYFEEDIVADTVESALLKRGFKRN